MSEVSQDTSKSLESKRFLAWRVGKKQEQLKMKAVHKLLNERPRLRHTTH
ncbi:MAG: hypothetical protein AAF569_04865 [Pseudomonadota bacterium]